jgi:lipoprotein-releasing system permease protein
MIPAEVSDVTTIQDYMVAGSVDALTANPDGIVLGDALVRKLSLAATAELTIAGGQSVRTLLPPAASLLRT